MIIRHIGDPNRNGWILAVPVGVDPRKVAEDPGRGISLPWTLRVALLDTSKERDTFTILEGSRKGQRASLKRAADGTSYLIEPHTQAATGVIRLSLKRQQFWYGAFGPFSAFSELDNPVPSGWHDLEIPDAPHTDYYPESRYQQVWFRIGHSGDRYLHLGTISHGCATVRPWLPDPKTDPRFKARSNSELGLPAPQTAQKFAHWDNLVRYLMPCRKDTVSVGTLQILD